jgi:hypothetical protein
MDDSQAEWPGEAQLRRDIQHFERRIARLASPNSIWEQGALKCYQVLVRQRREMLRELQSGELSNV